MKKILLALLISTLLLSGCSKTNNTDMSSIDRRIEEKQNLIVEEIPAETIDVTNTPESITEVEFTNYIEAINQDVEILTQKEELSVLDKETLKNTFITLTDFIFYGGEIKGKTFAELTDSVKQSVIELYERIDEKIEEKIPGYKDKIKDTSIKTYNNIKEKLLTLKDEITNKYKEQIGEDKYNAQVETFEESKETIKESFEPVIGTIVEESKEIYETTKDKLDNWYQTWKEENN